MPHPPSATSDRARPLVFWVLAFLRPYRGRVALLAALSVVEVALGALAPWPLKLVVDNVLGPVPLPAVLARFVPAAFVATPSRLLLAILVGGLVLQLTKEAVSMLHTQVQVTTGQWLVFDLRERLFAHLQALGMRHHGSVSAGDSVYRLEADAYCIENLVMTGFFPAASACLTLIVMVTVLLRLDVVLGALALSIVPFMYLTLRHWTGPLSVRAERVKALESTLVERLYETFSAIRVVKSFAREAYEKDRFLARGREALDSRVRLTWEESAFSVVLTSLTIVGTTLVLAVGGLHVLNGRLTIGTLLVVIAYLGSVFGPLSAIAHTAGNLQQSVTSMRRVRRSFAIDPEYVADGTGASAAGIRGDVRFDQVGFGYDGHRVLDGVTFEARQGEMVAIVGLTGAGKTTAVGMIPRFYDPSEGRVLVDGRDVREYDLRELRTKIALVLQDPVLFKGTIAENIRYGRLDATDEEVRRAGVDAYADDFIARLDAGYASEIGESGGGLSGGERQRISIARAILKDAPILILDEPTSSLDALSEEIVFSALRRLRSGRTTIVIAHRLSTIRDADRIIVLGRGRVIAEGRHDTLVAESDLYRRMWNRLIVGKSLDEPLTVDEMAEEIR